MAENKTTKDQAELSIAELGKILSPSYEQYIELDAIKDQQKQFQQVLRQANKEFWIDFCKQTAVSIGTNVRDTIINKIPFVAIMYTLMQHEGVIDADTGVKLVSKTIKGLVEASKAVINAPKNIDKITAIASHGKATPIATTDVSPILHGLGIFTAFLSVAVSSYQLKRSFDEKENIAELKLAISESVDNMLKNIQLLEPYKYNDVGIDDLCKLKRGQSKKQIQNYIGKFDQASIEELAVLIGKLNPADSIDKVYIKYAKEALDSKIKASANPEQAAQTASDIIAISAMTRAQRKIEQAKTLQDITIALKILGLALAVAGLVAACLATAGIAPAALGFALGIAGIALAIGSQAASSSNCKKTAEEIKGQIENAPKGDMLRMYAGKFDSKTDSFDSSIDSHVGGIQSVVSKSQTVFDKFAL